LFFFKEQHQKGEKSAMGMAQEVQGPEFKLQCCRKKGKE
jgi:hypothetical protein